jgi:hypothetical protein
MTPSFLVSACIAFDDDAQPAMREVHATNREAVVTNIDLWFEARDACLDEQRAAG